jgi:hypothetical protein
MHHRSLAVALLATLTAPAQARPVVLELFTSQACSSCPPADALLGQLQAQSGEILALSFHVTYWNGPGWTDPFSSPEATARQRDYAQAVASEVFTPQMIIDGHVSVTGSDRQAIEEAITGARARQAEGPAMTLTVSPAGLIAEIGAGQGPATLLLVGYDRAHTTRIRGGENGGVRLDETNVVRGLRAAGTWNGRKLRMTIAPPAGEKAAIILQRDDGTILGVAAA